MGDTMLLGVLRMPPELWRDDPLDVAQRHARYLEAADRIEAMSNDQNAVDPPIGGTVKVSGGCSESGPLILGVRPRDKLVGGMRKAKYYTRTEEDFEFVTWHAWGQMGDENGSYPAAIIEKSDGSVIVTEPERIIFCDRPKQ